MRYIFNIIRDPTHKIILYGNQQIKVLILSRISYLNQTAYEGNHITFIKVALKIKDLIIAFEDDSTNSKNEVPAAIASCTDCTRSDLSGIVSWNTLSPATAWHITATF